MTLIYLVSGWVCGILAAAFFALPTEAWILILFLPLGYFVLFRGDAALRKWHLILLCFVLGALRYQLALPTALDRELAQFNEQGRASLVGTVVADPDVRQTETLVRVAVSKIQTNGTWRETSGLALVAVARDTPVRYGDEVQVDGAPTTPPGGADFSYRDYLAREQIFTLVRSGRLYVISSGHGDRFWTALVGVRESAKKAINELLPEPSGALLTGILLGDERGLPTPLREDFNNTNTAHIIAISGYNISILILVLAFVIRGPLRFAQARVMAAGQGNGRAQALALGMQPIAPVVILVMLVLYTLLVGAQASVVRACIMGALALVAVALGRVSWAYTGLAAAAFVMTLLNPYTLWDVGFQLSFVATLGILLYVPRLQARLAGALQAGAGETAARRVVRFFQETLIVTAAAFFVTAPLLVLYFHRVSLIGFVTNLLVLPVQPAVMLLGGAATLLQMLANALAPIPFVGLIVGGMAQGVAWGAYIFLQYTILVVQGTAAVPYGSFDVGRVDVSLVILFYLIVLVVTRWGVRRSASIVFARAEITLTLLAVGVIFVWTTALAAPDPRTHILFIAADDGDATLIRTADDQRILINGTGEPAVLLSELGAQFPPWDRRLDMVIATHADDGNLASLNTVLERYAVGQVVEPPAPARGVRYTKWRELVTQKEIEAISALGGTRLRAGEVGIEILGTGSGGETDDERRTTVKGGTTNAVLRVDVNRQSFLIAPALSSSEQKALIQLGAALEAEVAVLPNQVEPEFLARISPSTVILFVGKSAQDKPDADTLKTLAGVAVLRTDERGNIEYILDGDEFQIQSQK